MHDTNLSPQHERRIRQLVSGIDKEQRTGRGGGIRGFTDVPLETRIKRDARRTNPVGEKVTRGCTGRS